MGQRTKPSLKLPEQRPDGWPNHDSHTEEGIGEAELARREGLDQPVPLDHLGADEAALEVGVDRAGGLLRGRALGDGPRLDLVLAPRDLRADRDGGGLGHRGVLDQHALQLERADAVVRGLEDVVGAADEGQIALVVGKHHVAAAIFAGDPAPAKTAAAKKPAAKKK